MPDQSIPVDGKKRGRPAGQTYAAPIPTRLRADTLAALDAAAAADPDRPSRSELIRRIVVDWLKGRGHIAGAVVLGLSLLHPRPAQAQVQPEAFSYPVGLNPAGDNWLALRSLPSATEGVRMARLGPETLFREIGRSGEWVRVRLLSGDTGWVNANYVGCCRTVTSAVPAPVPGPSCDELWFQRNAIFKAAGYCFRSARGISAFGNAGCQYDDEADVPLSTRDRARAAQIAGLEQRQGCPR